MTHPNFSDKSPTVKPPKLLDQVRDKLRVKHYSIRTEKSYTDWIKRYILFHGKRSLKGSDPLNSLRILYRCWQTHTPYNEAVYLKALERRGSPLLNPPELTKVA